MKKIFVFLAFLFTSFNVTLDAQVLWYGDPDLSVNDNFRRLDPDGNSNPTEDQCVDDLNNPPFVTKPTDPVFGKFWRITKPVSRKRAEFARTRGDVNDFEPVIGETYYYGWRWRINSTPDPSGDITVWQWKSDDGGNLDLNKQNYPLNMEYDGTILSLKAFGPAEPNWTSGGIFQRRTTLWRQVIEEDTWMSFVIKIKVDDSFDSTNNRYNGYIEFWFNGVPQTLTNYSFNQYQVVLDNNDTRAYHKTFDGVVNYPKWGSYNEQACDLFTETDFDEMRVTTTFESALPDGSSGVDYPDVDDGIYRLKNIKTGNYMTYNATDNNIYGSIEANDNTQLFSLLKNGATSSSGEELFNIVPEIPGTGVLNAINLNVFATTNNPPSNLNSESFKMIKIGGGIYHILANTSSLRYVGEVLDSNSNIHYTGGPWTRTEWILELQQSLSTDTFEPSNKFSLYPNPVNQELILIDDNNNINNVKIYSLTEELLIDIKIHDNTYKKIDASSLVSGMYLVKVIGENGISTKKIIKQ